MNERQIQLALHREYQNGSAVMAPNYTPEPWWECDIWRVTNASFAYEYEIKLSIHDYRKDASKNAFMRGNDQHGVRARRFTPGLQRLERQNKHKLLEAGDARGPNRFSFVMPVELIDKIGVHEIPDWAGVVSAEPFGGYGVTLRIVRSPPQLHRTKVDKTAITRCTRRLSFRYWTEIHSAQARGRHQ